MPGCGSDYYRSPGAARIYRDKNKPPRGKEWGFLSGPPMSLCNRLARYPLNDASRKVKWFLPRKSNDFGLNQWPRGYGRSGWSSRKS